jgi:hypothetical protein
MSSDRGGLVRLHSDGGGSSRGGPSAQARKKQSALTDDPPALTAIWAVGEVETLGRSQSSKAGLSRLGGGVRWAQWADENHEMNLGKVHRCGAASTASSPLSELGWAARAARAGGAWARQTWSFGSPVCTGPTTRRLVPGNWEIGPAKHTKASPDGALPLTVISQQTGQVGRAPGLTGTGRAWQHALRITAFDLVLGSGSGSGSASRSGTVGVDFDITSDQQTTIRVQNSHRC